MAWVASLFGLATTPRLTETIGAVLLAHVFFNYAVVVRTVGGRWAHLDRRVEDAARVLGASPWRTFREVTWPLLRPAVAAAAAIVFLFTFTSFGIILVLGGPRLATLEVAIYRATAQLLDLPTASVLALLQLLAVVASLAVYGRLSRRTAGRERLQSAAGARRAPRGRGERDLRDRQHRARPGAGRGPGRGAGGTLAAHRRRVRAGVLPGAGRGRRCAVRLAPGGHPQLAGVRRRPRRRSRWSWAGSPRWRSPAGRGGWTRVFDGLLMLPLGVSAVTVGFGFVIALDSPPLDLRSSPVLVPIAQALVATPFVIRLMVPVLESIDPRLRQAAAVLGATPRRVWREVDLPIAFRALTAAAGFAFAVSLGEFGATVFVARRRHADPADRDLPAAGPARGR